MRLQENIPVAIYRLIVTVTNKILHYNATLDDEKSF